MTAGDNMASPSNVVPQPNNYCLAEPSPQCQLRPPPDPQSDPLSNPHQSTNPQSEPQFDSPSALPPSSTCTAKRKRDNSDARSTDLPHPDRTEAKPFHSSQPPLRDEKSLIRNYFHLLQRYDTNPSILKRPLPEEAFGSAQEPQSKRHKSDDDTKAVCIEDKVMQDSYDVLDQLVLNLKSVLDHRAAEIRSAQSVDGPDFDEEALNQLLNLEEKALEIHSREMSYPESTPLAANNGPWALDHVVQRPSAANTVLTIFGNAPQPKILFSSTPKGDAEGPTKLPLDMPLPDEISLTTILPSTSSDQPGRVSTLGDLFPPPANLPPLQPPKAPKTTTKSKILGFYYPEPAAADRSRYWQGSYYSADLTTGFWLDYSNATPALKNRSRQRERTLSLAGQKPSSADIEMTEMEALFRRAFSTFAPEKDDSGAIIPSGEVARTWYQRHGHRYLQQIIESEMTGDASDGAEDGADSLSLDEHEIAEVIEQWDDSLIDPSMTMEDVLGKKSDQEKEVDDTLQEISDLIETLFSYQRNRNLTLPTSQNRNSADPAKADMLNGSLAQDPSDEERETYQMLKDQLAVIVSGLPPYAVARLNSDKLEELNVSTKLEVRTDVCRGVMGDDETSARNRQQQQQAAMQAAQTPRQQPQRASSYHTGTPYQAQQYNRPYSAQNQTPVPIPNHYQQSPVRPQMPSSYQRQAYAPPMPSMQTQQRQLTGQPFARPNCYTPQPMQPARPYGTPGAIPAYQAMNGQSRIATGYPGAAPSSGTPAQRYPPGYAAQQPQPGVGVQPQYHQQTNNFPPPMNGAGSIPQRTMSPQIAQYQATSNFSPRPGQQAMPHAQSYPTAGQAGQTAAHSGTPPHFPPNGAQQNHPHSPATPAPGSGPGSWVNPMSPQRQYEQQLHARSQAAARMNLFTEKVPDHHAVSGLGVRGGGLGLGGATVDMAKLAQVRANMPGVAGQSSPSPRPVNSAVVPVGVNGMQQPPPSQGPVPVASPSPVPSTDFRSGNPPA